MPDIKYEITKHIVTLSTNPRTSWTKELNLISWNDKEPKYDIRDWSPDHTKMGKGVTLSREELMALKAALGIGMVYVLYARIKEIRSGEEDDLGNY